MRITVLGSGSALSAPNRHNSCYLVEAGHLKILLDCGSDAMRSIQSAGVDFSSINSIFITHMHADHCGGLPAVITAMHVSARKEPLDVYVPHSQLEFVRTWFANVFIYNERLTFNISLHAIYPGKADLGNGLEFEFIENSHLQKYGEYATTFGVNPVSFSVAVRHDASHFFYSGDVERVEDMMPRLHDTLSFVEATHPSLEEIAFLARKNDANIYFTHIPQELEEGGEWKKELESRFGIMNLNIVHDGQVLVV